MSAGVPTPSHDPGSLAGTPPTDRAPFRPRTEILLILGVSLGQSAIYSILSIIEKSTRGTPLNEQTTTINNSVTPDRSWLDLAYLATIMPADHIMTRGMFHGLTRRVTPPT